MFYVSLIETLGSFKTICAKFLPCGFLGDEDVRADMSDALDRIAPEYLVKGEELYRHKYVNKRPALHVPMLMLS